MQPRQLQGAFVSPCLPSSFATGLLGDMRRVCAPGCCAVRRAATALGCGWVRTLGDSDDDSEPGSCVLGVDV